MIYCGTDSSKILFSLGGALQTAATGMDMMLAGRFFAGALHELLSSMHNDFNILAT